MTNIDKYLKFYAGQTCRLPEETFTMRMVDPLEQKVWAEWEEGFDYDFSKIKLVVRRISSMTREEWDELRMKMSYDLTGAYNSKPMFYDRPWHVQILENRISTNTLRLNDGIVLIEAGFWVFGDEAFDKKLILEP